MPTTNPAAAMDPRQLQAMDAPLVALTQQCRGDLRQLMHAYFSFLNRRTDFYLVPHPDDKDNQNVKMGFAEGDAEKMLIAAFRQFPLRRIPRGGVPATKGGPKQQQQKQQQQPKKPAPKANDKKASKSATAKPAAKQKESSAKDSEKESKPVAVETSKAETSKAETSSNSSDDTTNDNDDDEKKIPPNMRGVRYNEEGLQIPVGNGGSTPRYKWTQTIDETTVLIGVPKSFRGKDYSVSFTTSTLSVKAKRCLPGEDTPGVFLEGKLVDTIRPDESTWSLEGGVLAVTLEKKQKRFWTTICEDDIEKYKIDTELVDTRRRIGEYDDATQAQLRKTIFDQNQYHLNGPTSDEILGKTKQPSIPNGLPPGLEYKKDIDKKKLPAGVEFINQKTLDDATKGKK